MIQAGDPTGMAPAFVLQQMDIYRALDNALSSHFMKAFTLPAFDPDQCIT